jgi:hypothetical protein
MKQSIIVFSCLFFLFYSLCFAQDIAGSKDHPMFNRISGFYITEYNVEDFASEEFVDENGNDIKVEGKRTYIRYECDCEEAPLKIIRNYRMLQKILAVNLMSIPITQFI